MGKKKLEIEVLDLIGKVEEEAADKRYPVSKDTVANLIEKLESLLQSDTAIEDEYIEEKITDFEKIHRLVDGAPKKSIDHTAVNKVRIEFERKLDEHGLIEY